jgi:hemoglobin
MRDGHKKLVDDLGLTDIHFDAVMENLGASLKERGVPDDLIGEAAGIAESVRGDVLGR